ncbi:MAG: enoyl-CoA hydratase-related protein [Pseudomonadota bacterium]
MAVTQTGRQVLNADGADGASPVDVATGCGDGDLVLRQFSVDGYHILRLNRPAKKNALNLEMYQALEAGLRAGETDDTIAGHVLLGQAGVFCAGNDIADFAAAARREGLVEFTDSVLAFIRLLPRLRKPLIAGVDGLAVGIGTTLLFHCDLVFATERSRFSTPFVELGLVPEAGSSVLGPARLGYVKAFELLVSGRDVDTAWMVEAGCVNSVALPEDLDDVVCQAAKVLADKPRGAMLASTALMRSSRDEVIAQIEQEVEVFRERLNAPEALAAFERFLVGSENG